ncbi:hypothetical protein [Bradyrhizobium sp.]|jgi:hypothetical protein
MLHFCFDLNALLESWFRARHSDGGNQPDIADDAAGFVEIMAALP